MFGGGGRYALPHGFHQMGNGHQPIRLQQECGQYRAGARSTQVELLISDRNHQRAQNAEPDSAPP
ncbi:hypothetical protein J116_016080 [Streptomyces thermolilacinus SPC6]|uniref:Uncharacterized protein n=1 Tax=Streptomyces thermolilacinus SPC6 TaxID=1306406 RepID=A0A1D3DTW8_9ACTN|nr:hypothetical protein J116_016080 [Streptomyces thermolilacinus SPC6]